MRVGSSDKVVAKILLDLGGEATVSEVALKVRELHEAGVRLYGTDDFEDIKEHTLIDAYWLSLLRLVRVTGNTLKLTGRGEALAMNFVYPEWVESRMDARASVSKGPA